MTRRIVGIFVLVNESSLVVRREVDLLSSGYCPANTLSKSLSYLSLACPWSVCQVGPFFLDHIRQNSETPRRCQLILIALWMIFLDNLSLRHNSWTFVDISMKLHRWVCRVNRIYCEQECALVSQLSVTGMPLVSLSLTIEPKWDSFTDGLIISSWKSELNFPFVIHGQLKFLIRIR